MQSLGENEVYTLFLISRRKWFKELPSNYELLDYEVVKESSFEEFYSAVLRLIPQDCAYTSRGGKCIPKSAMAIYVDIIPKDIKKGVVKTIEKFIRILAFENDSSKFKGFCRIMLSNLQKSPSRKPYFLIDVDSKDNSLIEYITEQLRKYSVPVVWISETKGGYHIIARRDGKWMKDFYESIYPVLKNINNVEIKLEKSLLTPIPGSFQGGFPVKGVWNDV
ncbi:hypothetical protein Py04_1178 [Pyrococcus sp. ST04]|nr:hypothetical protein Py04_1178 [Pyrococcus sp. ST04]